jgi:1-acyl-sn-glycerol-3-phosphate acyltransferase
MVDHKFSRSLINFLGWKGVGGAPSDRKCIVIGVPHTSLWDFFISFYYLRAVGVDPHVMIKKELFRGRLGSWLRERGSIPIDRENPTQTILNVVHAFKTHDDLCLGMAPEGTRKPVKKWKTGYYTIAKAAQIPVYLGWLDWKTKTISVGERYEVCDNAALDMKRIQLYYRKMDLHAKHLSNFIFPDEIEEAYRTGKEF